MPQNETASYALKNNFVRGADVGARYLNRVGNVLSAQVPGALEAIGEGVFGAADFEVSNVGGTIVVAAGRASVRHTRGHLVVVQSQDEIEPIVPAAVGSDPRYVQLQLLDLVNPGDPDTTEGSAPTIVVTADESVPNAQLLAEIDSAGGVTDRRRYVDSYVLFARIAQLEADVGYDAAARAKGSVDERINALGAGTDDNGQPATEVTLAMFNALKAQLAALHAQIAVLKAQNGLDAPLTLRLNGRVEELRAEHSRLALSTMRELPRTAQRLNSAIVVGGLAGNDELLPDGTHQKAVYLGGSLQINAAKRRME